MLLHSEPATAQAGVPLTLRIELYDGASGQPVDDLELHHEALLHLVVIDDRGMAFEHGHPARIAPGRFAYTLVPPYAGDYTAYAEIVRHGSGTQLLQARFTVAGAAAPYTPASGLGTQQIDTMQVTVVTYGRPQAGRAVPIILAIRDAAGPVSDIEPWLEMAGHLMVRRADGVLFAHVHAMADGMTHDHTLPMPTTPLPDTGPYGPEIRFSYTFAQAGQYQCWAQFRRGSVVYTVPFLVDVEP
ncbi:MAG TPA: hypothetical protein PKC19_03365 [Roseiflexaceae bacterium]|nr:hypothetical protein [Roseiflexaceae bacterium]